MKKLLIVLLLLITTPSFADWKYVVTTADDTADYYIDMDQIRKEGGLVYFWALTNLKKPDSTGDLSYIFLVQGDCKLFRVIFFAEHYYKKNMGKGKLSSSHLIPSDWTSPEKDTVNEVLLKKACEL